MELPWVLLVLAGMDTVAGLGESLGGCEGFPVGSGVGVGVKRGCVWLGVPALTAVPSALVPYVPRVPPDAMPGKVTASTFALERPCCIFDPHANASDAVWLVVAFADASAAFKNPTSGAEVPPYEALPTARAYMTLEMAAAAYGCSAPGAAVLRVGGDTACHGPAHCNGPLPSPGPYRVKFLLMSCHGPRAETKWSDPILLRRARSLTTIDPTPAHRSSSAVIIAALLASLGAALAMAMLGAAGYEWGDRLVSALFELHGPCLMPAPISPRSTLVCVPLCRRDLGSHLPYRTHHVPPALPHTLPPTCICGCTRPRGPCPTK
ncbi:UNVERIFIED_CONTAM: hypothetical protein H355_011256 [Colinus virginianus]|nr:hypothetical protein H355_011256 [Colinus virginianus]